VEQQGKKIKLTLTRSISGRLKKQERTVQALGLKKIGESKIFTDGAAIRGMINVVSHMVTVEAAE
jgi:large subunit ribosomal protein L30